MVREVGCRRAEERSGVGIKIECFQDRIPDCDKEIRITGIGMSMSMCRLSNHHGSHQPGIDQKVTIRSDPRVPESTWFPGDQAIVIAAIRRL